MHVRMSWYERGKRLGPLDQPMGEEVESFSLKFLTSQPVGWDFAQAVSRETKDGTWISGMGRGGGEAVGLGSKNFGS